LPADVQAAPRRVGVRRDQVQPWQSYIGTNFNVQRRMADYYFERAQTWEELLERHAAWVHDFNIQKHWAQSTGPT
jgi:putative transposase